MLKTKLLFSVLFSQFIFFSFHLQAQFTANFTTNKTEGCGVLAGVNFTATSTGGTITSWNWDFGNTNTSTLPTPSATYTSPGNYTVQLIVGNGTSFDTIIKVNYIKVYRNPTANFTFGPSSGCPPLTVSFNNSSSIGDAPLQTFEWDVRDGTPIINGTNPQHSYQSSGTYNPNLRIIDQNGCTDNISKGPIIVSPAPIASFTTQGPRLSCSDSLIVNFINTSTGQLTNATYLWDFGDGNTSVLANPTHTYRGFGLYDVRLTVNGTNCSSSQFEDDYIQLEQPNALFNLPKKEFCYGESFQIDNQSTGGSIYAWDFGDGNTSSAQNPTHQYLDSGNFIISLTILGVGCVDQFFDTVYVERVIANFITDTTFTCNPYDSVHFINTSINAVSYQWRIAYGGIGAALDTVQIDTTRNTVHYYNGREGVFSDTLYVVSPLGCVDSLIKDSSRVVDFVTLHITDDTLSALNDIVNGCAPLLLDVNSNVFFSIPGDSVISYDWNFGNFAISTVKNPPAVTFNSDTLALMTLSIVTKEGCRREDTVRVDPGIKINPVVSIFPDTVCSTDSVFITDMTPNAHLLTGVKYVTFGRDSTSTADLEFGADTPGVVIDKFLFTGYHQLEVIYTNDGCNDTLEIDSAFYVEGPIILNMRAESNCTNRLLINFFSTMSGSVNRFYWDFGDSTALDSLNENPIHQYSRHGRYKITLTAYDDSSACPPMIDSIFVNTFPLTFLRSMPDLKNFCLNEEVEFRHTNASSYAFREWKLNGQVVSNDSTFTKTFYNRGTIPLELRAIDYLGCPDSTFDTIYVSQPIPDFDFNFNTACLPNEVMFTDQSIIDTTIINSYWIRNNGDTLFPPTPTTIYDQDDLGMQDVYFYIQNLFDCKDSILEEDLFEITDFEVKIRHSGTNLCHGDSAFLRNAALDTNATYIWDFGDGNSDTTNQEFIRHVYQQAGTFEIKLQGTDDKGCVLRDSILFFVDPKPIVGFRADFLASSCYPLDVHFTDTSSGPIVGWEWRFGDGDTSFLQNPFHQYLFPGIYDVFLKVVTANGCVDSVLFPAYIEVKGPTADYMIDKSEACVNETVNFSISNQLNVSSFIWDFGDGDSSAVSPASHEYTSTGKKIISLVLRDSTGNCKITLIDSITIFDIKADFTISNDTGCTPFIATFTNTSIGADSFNWIFEDGSISTNMIENRNYSQASENLIQLAISSTLGCIDTAKKFLRIFQTPIAAVSRDTGICFGDSVQLIASGGDLYQWDPTQFMTSGNNDTTIVFPDTSTVYSVEVSSLEGCADTASVEVLVIKAPNYSLIDTTLIIGENLNINVGPFGFNYQWTPSIGLSCDNCPNPIAQPLSNQTYVVNISDDFGCFNITDSIRITVTEAFSLDVPNAFSPNGDGINDVIYAKGWGLKELIAFKIYNRFGELVFESTDFENGWDGLYRGKLQNVETYIYTVEALTYGNKVLSKKGNISLLR